MQPHSRVAILRPAQFRAQRYAPTKPRISAGWPRTGGTPRALRPCSTGSTPCGCNSCARRSTCTGLATSRRANRSRARPRWMSAAVPDCCANRWRGWGRMSPASMPRPRTPRLRQCMPKARGSISAISRARSARSGSGLGLAIVQQIAVNHGGRVEARNHPEGGTSMELTLPRMLSE